MLKPDLYQIFTINSVVTVLFILTVHHEIGLQLMISFIIDQSQDYCFDYSLNMNSV